MIISIYYTEIEDMLNDLKDKNLCFDYAFIYLTLFYWSFTMYQALS